MGITQLSYFVRFFGGLVAIVAGMLHERKLSLLLSLPKLFRVLTLIKPTFTNFGQVWDEFRDLDDAEREELEAVLAIELEANTDDVEQKKAIQKGVLSALSFLELITSFKSTSVK